jgi:hypothetical protein
LFLEDIMEVFQHTTFNSASARIGARLIAAVLLCLLLTAAGCGDDDAGVAPVRYESYVGSWNVRVDSGASTSGPAFRRGTMNLSCGWGGLSGIMTLGSVRYLVTGDCTLSYTTIDWDYDEIVDSPFPIYRWAITGTVNSGNTEIHGWIEWDRVPYGSNDHKDYRFTATR